MDRNEAYSLMERTIPNANLRKHMLACEACMRALAAHFSEDAEAWGLAGLLHDLDYDRTAQDFSQHGKVTVEMLKDKGLSEDILHAILAHPFGSRSEAADLRAGPGQVKPESLMDWALYAVDPTTGLLVAAALMHPTKKLGSVDVPFVMKRFKEKRFAAGANREQIQTCSRLGLNLEEFTGHCLKAMQGISGELGL
jgi:putative nucleotidyltransferase with HDIG domain